MCSNDLYLISYNYLIERFVFFLIYQYLSDNILFAGTIKTFLYLCPGLKLSLIICYIYPVSNSLWKMIFIWQLPCIKQVWQKYPPYAVFPTIGVLESQKGIYP